jgi:hypothetical protein
MEIFFKNLNVPQQELKDNDYVLLRLNKKDIEEMRAIINDFDTWPEEQKNRSAFWIPNLITIEENKMIEIINEIVKLDDES